jgi:hypothetical protein
MRITKDSHQVLINNKTEEFLDKAASFLSSRFETLTLSRGITNSILKESVYQCYLWTELHSYPSQLFAVRIACARLCFGSFFMEDIRYTALRDIVGEHLRTHKISDEDRIHDYIVTHQADWQTDWFSEHLPLTSKLCTARNSIPPGAVFMQLYAAEQRSSFSLTEENRQNIFQQLMSSARYPDSSDHLRLLLAIAQYYDGFRCFEDPLRPRWSGLLAPQNRQHLSWQLQDIFSTDRQ